MFASIKNTTKLALSSLACIYCTTFSASAFAIDIAFEAPLNQTIPRTISASDLGVVLTPNEQLIVCIDNECTVPFSGQQSLARRDPSNETYTISGATISYSPTVFSIDDNELRIPYEACPAEVTESGLECTSPPITGDIVFTITDISTPPIPDPGTDGDTDGITQTTPRDRNKAGSAFINDICLGENSEDAHCTAYGELPEDEQATALDEINPQEVAAQNTVTKQLAKAQAGNVSRRIGQLRSGNGGNSVNGLTLSIDGQPFSGKWLQAMVESFGGSAGADEPASVSKLGFFINGSLTDGKRDASDLERGYDNEANSVTFGADYRINSNLIAGIAYGVSNSSLEFDDNNDGMDNDMNNIILYGTWYKDAFNVDLVLGASLGEIETTREIAFASVIAEGKTDTQQAFLSIAGSYDFNDGALAYGPYSSFDYTTGTIDSYSETNGGGLGVSFDDQDINSKVLTMGGRVSYAFSTGWGVIVPYARAEWKKEFDDSRDIISGQFLSEAAAEFTVEAEDFDTSWFHAGAGISATFRHGLSAYIDYDSILAYDDTELSTISYGGRWEAAF
ncbi:MAG: hypothetical protein COA99_05895 [Moraxellaceae bacterium]|nr:MAG: hypothetical protein COA99_05895 [Moraxellaceae bacterium]